MTQHESHRMQETSIKSYDELLDKLGTRHEEIYEAIKRIGTKYKDATDQEVKEFLGQLDANYVRPRRNELVNDMKLIGFSRKRKCSVTGKTAMAWKVLQRRIVDYENRKMSRMQTSKETDETLRERAPYATLSAFM
jgi:hypothetical protein